MKIGNKFAETIVGLTDMNDLKKTFYFSNTSLDTTCIINY